MSEAEAAFEPSYSAFGTAPDYHELNAGAHRRPPKVLSAPALVRHLAFWTNFGGHDPSGRHIPKLSPEQIKNSVDAFIVALSRIVQEFDPAAELTPNICSFCLLFNSYCHDRSFAPIHGPLTQRQYDIFKSTSRSVSLQFVWHRLDVTIRFEIFTEYFSISTFMELNKSGNDQPGDYSDLDELNENILDAREFLNLRKTVADAKNRADEVAKEINDYFFHKIWATFDRTVLDALPVGARKARPFRRIVGDFRGLILSEQEIEFANFGKEVELGRKFTWGQDAKAAFLPLIQHREGSIRYECTVNYLLDGRALYMSTLGPQSPSIPDDQRIPVEFILYTNHRYPKRSAGARAPDNSKTIVNKWQLGRLVSQVLLLGTLRLCALKDVKLLHDSGQALGLLDESTQAARTAIANKEEVDRKKRAANRRRSRAADLINSGGMRTRLEVAVDGEPAALNGETSENDDEVMDRIAQAHQQLNRINERFLTVTGSGLLYRVERSRYYVKQFEENVGSLRIKRVEGNQPYDQFIKRRLGSEFDFIDRLGIRYERASRNIVTLDQNYLAITQNALVEQANQIDKDIHTIQKWGEIVLILALVPYYITHLLVLIFGEENASLMAVNVWLFSFIILVVKNNRPERALARFRSLARSTTVRILTLVFLIMVVLLPLEIMSFNRHHRPYQEIQATLQEIKQAIERENGLLANLLAGRPAAPGPADQPAPENKAPAPQYAPDNPKPE